MRLVFSRVKKEKGWMDGGWKLHVEVGAHYDYDYCKSSRRSRRTIVVGGFSLSSLAVSVSSLFYTQWGYDNGRWSLMLRVVKASRE